MRGFLVIAVGEDLINSVVLEGVEFDIDEAASILVLRWHDGESSVVLCQCGLADSFVVVLDEGRHYC